MQADCASQRSCAVKKHSCPPCAVMQAHADTYAIANVQVHLRNTFHGVCQPSSSQLWHRQLGSCLGLQPYMTLYSQQRQVWQDLLC